LVHKKHPLIGSQSGVSYIPGKNHDKKEEAAAEKIHHPMVSRSCRHLCEVRLTKVSVVLGFMFTELKKFVTSFEILNDVGVYYFGERIYKSISIFIVIFIVIFLMILGSFFNFSYLSSRTSLSA
jgi:hypothetical protein